MSSRSQFKVRFVLQKEFEKPLVLKHTEGETKTFLCIRQAMELDDEQGQRFETSSVRTSASEEANTSAHPWDFGVKTGRTAGTL